MCGRYSFSGSVEILKNTFGIEHMDLEPVTNYNVAPSQLVPAVLKENNKVQLRHLRWGLIPSWANEPTIGDFMINAREDSLLFVACFKYAFKNRRCLIPAKGYFDWADDRGGKQPFFITTDSGDMFGFAGLWEKWIDTHSGAAIESCTIITTDASPEIAHLNERMPVVLDRKTYQTWLDPELQDPDELSRVLAAGKVGQFKFHSVSRDVNSMCTHGPGLIQPVN